ncbi:MAG: enoyl-CoA hydratase/isomerase family protein [Bdellovibrionales bacterium]
MNFETLKLEIKNQVAYLTISRPKALNALNLKVLEELKLALKDLKTHKISSLILKGDGDKAFVAGADIKEMSLLNPKQAKKFSKKGQDIFALIENLPFPVIAVIQGFALGGGLELALACDLLILEKEARIGLPEVTLSLLPSFFFPPLFSRCVGTYKAKEMIFTGNFYTAQEALDMGLANKIVAKEQLLKEAESIAETIRSRGPIAIDKSKQLIHKSRDVSVKKGLQLESQFFGDLFRFEDSKEGMRAFIQKRKAQFKGSKN